MRELTVRIRFTSPSLGNVKKSPEGHYLLPTNPDGFVTFLGTWHQANMALAAKLLGRHQDEIRRILWDIVVDGRPLRGQDRWFKRYYTKGGKGRRRYCLHECFPVGHVVGLNCAVPSAISDDDMLELMNLAGRYCGLSPFKPKEFGHFAVESIRARRNKIENKGPLTDVVEEVLKNEEPAS